MNKFTAFDIATGQILFSGTAENTESLADAITGVLDGYIYSNGWLDAGVYFPQPPQPSEHHEFDWVTKQWIDQLTPEKQWVEVRIKRDKLLKASDWTQLPDVPLPTKDAWAVYRQALRDVTMQPDPFNIVWPTAP